MAPFYLRPCQLETLEDRIAPATFLVTTLSDDPNDIGSLRHAINEANLHKGKDTIAFDKPLVATPQILTLTSDLPTITDDIVIQGPGAKNLTIDGDGQYRIFRIDDGSDTVIKKAAISSLTLSNSDTATNIGGIYCLESLTLTNSVISGNKSGGIGVYTDGKLFVANTKVIDNLDGGLAATANGGIKIINSVIAGNVSNYSGAGISVYSEKSILIDKTLILNNHSTDDGGGVSLSGLEKTKILIRNSVISGNTSDRNGGGIVSSNSAYAGNVTLEKTIVSGNTAAKYGGGLHSYDQYTLKIKDCQFLDNSAGDNGGGMYIDQVDAVSITGSLISGNQSGFNGGGAVISNSYLLNISKTTQFIGNKATGLDAVGGGLIVDNGVANISAAFYSNSATGSGGAMLIEGSFSTLNLKGAIVSNNHSGADGGGMRCDSHVINIIGTKFIGNSADYGGGLSCYPDPNEGKLLITKTLFAGNVANIHGGGLWATLLGGFGENAMLIKSSTFTNNKALNGDGGGAYIDNHSGTTATIIGTLFTQNSAKGDGGGLFLSSEGTKTLIGLSILNNFSEAAGGGIFMNFGNLVLQKGIIYGNIASTTGGGIHNNSANNASTTVNATKIIENFAPIDSDTSGV